MTLPGVGGAFAAKGLRYQYQSRPQGYARASYSSTSRGPLVARLARGAEEMSVNFWPDQGIIPRYEFLLPPSGGRELAISFQQLGSRWIDARTLVTFAGKLPGLRSTPAPNTPPLRFSTLKMASNTIHPGILHRISRPSSNEFKPPFLAFEHGNSPQPPKTKSLVFLGGFFDGLATVPDVPSVVKALPPSWTLVEPTLSSAYRQWGFSSLGEDIAEISNPC